LGLTVDALAGGGVPTRPLTQAAVHARTGVALRPRGGQRSRPPRADHDELVLLRPDPLAAAAAAWDVVPRTCARFDDTRTFADLVLAEKAALARAAGALHDGGERDLEHPRTAAASPATVGTAMGIAMAQQGCGPNAVAAELWRHYRHADRTIRDIAEGLVLASASASCAGDAP